MRGNFTNHARKYPAVEVVCPCGKPFQTDEGRIAQGRGTYCSKPCGYRYRVRPKGLKYNITGPNPTAFKPGHETWNKGMCGAHFSPDTEFKPGERVSPETEFKPGVDPWNKDTAGVMPSGEEHHSFLGDQVGYDALHRWVARWRGKPTACEHCGARRGDPGVSRIHWANRSHEYRRELDDWLALCPKCHAAYDAPHRGAIARRWGASCVAG